MTGLPPSLDRFGAELEDAVHRDLRGRRRRRLLLGGTAVVAAAAAVALGILSVLPTGGPSVVQRAAAALQSSDDSILHYQFDAVQQNGDGTVATWSDETWQLRVAPYTRRQIEIDSNAPRAESVTSGDTNELFDSRADTIYIATNQQLLAARMPKIEIVSASKLAKLTGSRRVSVAVAYQVGKGVPVKVLATKQGAKRYRQQLAQEQKQPSGVLPEEFRSEILALLRSGRVRVVGHVNVDGRDAIKLESLDGKQVYVVDAASYDPIEWTTTGNGGGVTLHFSVYEELPVDNDSMALLNLEKQHPGASVVRDPAAYIAAESRLYPHG
jgi:outer membrane lipoprotein-sorting protein